MALVEVARFADLTEAEVAAAGLRASGIVAFVQNAGLCQNLFHMRIAWGGARLWAAAEDFEDVRAWLAACRTTDRDALRWTRHPDALAGAPLAMLALILSYFPGEAGWLIAGMRRRFSLIALALVLAVILGSACLMWLVFGPHEVA